MRAQNRFWRMFGPLAALALAMHGNAASVAKPLTKPAAAATVTIQKITLAPNPTGLKIGFFELGKHEPDTLAIIGARPMSRAGFDGWINFESSPGQYTFGSPETVLPHTYGEQVASAVNISFSTAITPGKTTIPSFYPNDITNPATRAAAKRFLYAYVQYQLKAIGSCILTIDYEIVSNWRLSDTDAGRDARANTWAAWYIEAAATARQAASDLGMAGALKLAPIVNGDPLSPGNPLNDPSHDNSWLKNAMAVSDYLGIDDYHSNPNATVTDPQYIIDTIAFWINGFAGNKGAMVMENGFTTVTTQDPTITRKDRDMKLTGTEKQQQQYFAALFPALAAANQAHGAFHNQLRAFNMWEIIDNLAALHSGDPDEGDAYFGVAHADDTDKLATPTVRSAIAQIDADSYLSPTKAVGLPLDVTSVIGNGVALKYTEGDDHDYLRYVDSNLAAGSLCHLTGTVSNPGYLLVSINGAWNRTQVAAGNFDINLGAGNCKPGASNEADVFGTSEIFPAAQTIAKLKLKTS